MAQVLGPLPSNKERKKVNLLLLLLFLRKQQPCPGFDPVNRRRQSRERSWSGSGFAVRTSAQDHGRGACTHGAGRLPHCLSQSGSRVPRQREARCSLPLYKTLMARGVHLSSLGLAVCVGGAQPWACHHSPITPSRCLPPVWCPGLFLALG